MVSLVGYTGFVGSNIWKMGKSKIDYIYNSHSISEAYDTHPDLLIYAGLRAEKYLANSAPERDMQLILEAERNIEKIQPQKLVLISTIDVLKNPNNVDEDSKVEVNGLQAYGYNRHLLECWVRDHFQDALIIRLPALFGENIKKNFIYDYINVIPYMLKNDKMEELIKKAPCLIEYYDVSDNGFYKVKNLPERDRMELKKLFQEINFSALNFTDSRSRFQFYNLERLWDDIGTALHNKITLWHPATEPVSTSEIYRYLTGRDFTNILQNEPANYDYRTKYADMFGGKNGYICDKETVLREIGRFVHAKSTQ